MAPNRIGLAAILPLALCAAACASEASHGGVVDSAGAGAGGIGRVAQALGSFSQLWSGSAGAAALHVGETYSLFRTVGGSSCSLDVVSTVSGTKLTVISPPFACANVSAAGSDSDDLFVVDGVNGRLFSLEIFVSAGGGPSGSYFWATGPVIPVGTVVKVLANSSYVFLEYADAIYRVQLAGGSTITVATNRRLLGLEGSTLYIQRLASGEYTLRTMSISGGTQTPIATHANSFQPDFSFDANYFYWVENGPTGSTNRLRRLPKAGGTVPGFKADSAVTYQLPRSSGSTVYWFETTISTGSMRIRRMSIGGSHVSEPFPFTAVSDMRAVGSWLYLTPRIPNPTPTYALYRGDL